MKTLTAILLAMTALPGFGQIHAPLKPIPDEYFEQIRDTPNPSWGEFDQVLRTSVSCNAVKGRKPPLCEKADEAMFSMLWQALHRVVAANVLAKNKGFGNVCDAYAESLVLERQYGPQASYALLLVSNHMGAAKSMYAAPVEKTPLYRVLYNAMADEKPCQK